MTFKTKKVKLSERSHRWTDARARQQHPPKVHVAQLEQEVNKSSLGFFFDTAM